MVYKACTFGTQSGPCYSLPTIAVWTRKHDGHRIWACEGHDRVLDTNIRRAKARSQWRRQSMEVEV